jgi:hypothetical protein
LPGRSTRPRAQLGAQKRFSRSSRPNSASKSTGSRSGHATTRRALCSNAMTRRLGRTCVRCRWLGTVYASDPRTERGRPLSSGHRQSRSRTFCGRHPFRLARARREGTRYRLGWAEHARSRRRHGESGSPGQSGVARLGRPLRRQDPGRRRSDAELALCADLRQVLPTQRPRPPVRARHHACVLCTRRLRKPQCRGLSARTEYVCPKCSHFNPPKPSSLLATSVDDAPAAASAPRTRTTSAHSALSPAATAATTNVARRHSRPHSLHDLPEAKSLRVPAPPRPSSATGAGARPFPRMSEASGESESEGEEEEATSSPLPSPSDGPSADQAKARDGSVQRRTREASASD